MKDRELNLGSYSLFSTIKSLILIIALIVMFKHYYYEKTRRVEVETLVEASNKEVEKWVDRHGQNLAKIQILETANKENFLSYETQNQTIKELQKLVKENKKLLKGAKGAAGIIKSITEINATSVTKIEKDKEGDPVYSSKIEDPWFEAYVKASKDSTDLKIKTMHNLSLVMGYESEGLFKKKKPYAIAKDANPYSDIKDMRIYNITKTKHKFSVGPYFGPGLSVTGGALRFGWNAGIGVNYSLNFEF